MKETLGKNIDKVLNAFEPKIENAHFIGVILCTNARDEFCLTQLSIKEESVAHWHELALELRRDEEDTKFLYSKKEMNDLVEKLSKTIDCLTVKGKNVGIEYRYNYPIWIKYYDEGVGYSEIVSELFDEGGGLSRFEIGEILAENFAWKDRMKSAFDEDYIQASANEKEKKERMCETTDFEDDLRNYLHFVLEMDYRLLAPLFTYCCKYNKKYDFDYIRSIAEDWHNKGIETREQAESYIAEKQKEYQKDSQKTIHRSNNTNRYSIRYKGYPYIFSPYYIKEGGLDILKPCPFCGCEDIVIKNQFSTRNGIYYTMIECNRCGATTRSKPNTSFYDPEDDEFWESDSTKEVINLWNTRI